MGLFFRRPLALFSFLFLIFALLSYNASVPMLILCMIVALAVILLLGVAAFIFKKVKMKLLVIALCISAVFFALLQSLLYIAIPISKAEKYEGEGIVHCYVIDKTDEGEYSNSYIVKLKRIGDESVSIRAHLTCGFDAGLCGGDEIYGVAQIKAKTGDEPSQLLSLYMDDTQSCYVRYTSEGKGIVGTLFSECGAEILSNRLSNYIGNKLQLLLGDMRGSLAMGFFTGDRSEIPTDITRDFRRAGVSHLMAVSGSHIAILLGGIELILKKLQVHKSIRIIVVSFFSVGFLFITGFSLSAIRSVFMLYAVYLAYFLREGSDAITSLFVSILAIVLIFPHSIVDLGLWMSFLATLGLLTVYPVAEEKIPYPGKKPRIMRWLLKVGRELLLIAIMTVVANMFLLPIIWIYFKEFSVVSILSNILITYPSSLFLLSVPILLLTCRIPLVGTAINWIVSFLADIIIFTVRLCSKIPNATISLKYEFCNYIVLIFTVLMSVFLIVRFKKKLIALLPFGFVALSFSLCFGVYSIFISSPEVTYLNYGKNEILAVNDNTELSICDNTSGGLSTFWQVRGLVDSSYATQINKYIYTDYSEGNEIAFELLKKNFMINSLYLPTPVGNEEIARARALYDMALESGIEVIFYDNDDIIKQTRNVTSQVIRKDSEKGSAHILFWCGGKSIAYAQAEYCQTDRLYDVLIVGESYERDKIYDLKGVRAKELYLSTASLTDGIILPDGIRAYIPEDDKNGYEIEFDFK